MLMPMTSCYIFADYADAQHFFSCADNADSGYFAESGISSNLSGKLDLQFAIFSYADE